MFELQPKETTSNITLRFPDELLDKIREISHSSGTSISQIVFQACQYALSSMQKRGNNP